MLPLTTATVARPAANPWLAIAPVVLTRSARTSRGAYLVASWSKRALGSGSWSGSMGRRPRLGGLVDGRWELGRRLEFYDRFCVGGRCERRWLR